MTSFRISFESDSIEGISALVRLSAGAGISDVQSGFRESTPPPAPGLRDGSGSAGSGSTHGETPPPIPALPGASGEGDSDHGGVDPPPMPTLRSSSAGSAPMDSTGEVGLPPDPDQKVKTKKVAKARSRKKEKPY